MSDCVFCKIVKKEIPTEIAYENDNFLAFLDINPRSPGHCQVIPKRHYRWVWDLPNVGEYFEVVKKIAQAQQQAFKQDGIWSRITGEEVEHAHVWLFPDPRPNKTTGDKNNFAGNAEKIRVALATD